MDLENIKKLANLARIEMTDEEMKGMAREFDPILAYVGQVQEAVKLISGNGEDKNESDYKLKNVMREDTPTSEPDIYSEKIIKEMPESEKDFLKVKQIL